MLGTTAPAEEGAMPNSEIPDLRRQDLEPDATVRQPTGEPVDPQSAPRLAHPRPDEAPLRVQRVDQPAAAAGQTLKVTFLPASGPSRWKVPLVLGLVVVLGGSAYLAFSRSKALPPPQPAAAPPRQSLPPAAKAILEQAEAGDVRAMHTLGLMYYNGLNLPQDRKKGLYWLRKAAEKGSVGARSELSQIEGGR
jgi:TPR repeat protein